MTEQFKPNATVAAIVKCNDHYLYVEEEDNGIRVINQPAGHLEEKESLIDAVKRELYEETGLELDPNYLVGIYYFHSPLNEKYYLRFCFAFEVTELLTCTPHDSDIVTTHWLTKEELHAKKSMWRSDLVGKCLDDFLSGIQIPLSAIKSNL